MPIPTVAESYDTSAEKPSFSFSQIALYAFCPFAFRLRELLGFQPPLAKELGYGKCLHHLLRRLAEYVRSTGKLPGPYDVDKLFKEEFYLAFATGPAFERMKNAARKIIDQYLSENSQELFRVWATERNFELHLARATIDGRADVILDREESMSGNMAILDYKTTVYWDKMEVHIFQLHIYSTAARLEGINVKNAYVHDLKEGRRVTVDIGEEALERAVSHARHIVDGILQRRLEPSIGDHCVRCDVRPICKAGSDYVGALS